MNLDIVGSLLFMIMEGGILVVRDEFSPNKTSQLKFQLHLLQIVLIAFSRKWREASRTFLTLIAH